MKRVNGVRDGLSAVHGLTIINDAGNLNTDITSTWALALPKNSRVILRSTTNVVLAILGEEEGFGFLTVS